MEPDIEYVSNDTRARASFTAPQKIIRAVKTPTITANNAAFLTELPFMTDLLQLRSAPTTRPAQPLDRQVD